MRKGFLAAAALLAGAGITLGQQPAAPLRPAPAPAVIMDAPPANMAGAPMADVGHGDEGCDHGRLWASGEYLYWWVRNAPSPVLVSVTSAGSSASLGGTQPIDFEPQSGLRLSVGGWLDSDGSLGVETTWFWLSSRSDHFIFSGTGGTGQGTIALVVPTLGGGAFEFPVTTPSFSFPGIGGATTTIPGIAGTANVSFSTKLDGAEGNGVLSLAREGGMRAELLGGFRFIGLDENLTIAATTAAVPGFVGGASTVTTTGDEFSTKNRFYGGQVGGRFSFTQGKFFAGLTTKIGVGDTSSTVDTLGHTGIFTAPALGTPTLTSSTSGLFTQTGNLGHFTKDETSLIGEIGLTVGYQVTGGVRVFGGYNFLYWSDVLRPADQISGVNPFLSPALITPFPGEVIPAGRASLPLKDSEFWAQGLNVGVEIRY